MKSKRKLFLNKIFLAGGATIFAALLFVIIFSKSYAYIQITPRSADVYLNGMEFREKTTGTYRTILENGRYNIEAYAEGYVGLAKEYSFRRGLKTNVLLNLAELPKVTTVEANGDQLSFDGGNTFYFLNKNGSALKKGVVEDGKITITALTDQKLSGIKEIIWSPERDLALLRKNDGSVNLFDFKKYDFVNQTETPWGNNVGSIAWSPDNSKIAYFYSDGNEKSLIFANTPNTQKERVLNFNDYGIDNPTLSWSPDSNNLLVVSKSQDVNLNKVYVFNIFSRQLIAITKTGDFGSAIFNLDGQYVLTNKGSGDSSKGNTLRIKLDDPENPVELAERFDLTHRTLMKDRPNEIYTFSIGSKLFGFDFMKNIKSGLIMSGIGDKEVTSFGFLNKGKALVFQNGDGISTVNLGSLPGSYF